ncbi:TonB-dependent receptor [Apibacter muscae]|uniref:TonB-dependent siderophore receptor n=1 Tax=Apibacter muscae TaxID=2509004 RepID=UPI0011AD6946|nr:TonB-dependent receptor [Apibacter muscae]TWP31409.1 TonB-dependent receptor [Apibacter muscae]
MKKINNLIFPSLTLLIVPSFFSQKINAQTTTDSIRGVTLEEVKIQAPKNRHYNTNNISKSLRLDGDILDISQNIQSIDQSVIKDQLSLNVNESVTRNVSGTFREELHNGISSDIYSRGGYINAQRNGVDLRPLLKGPLGDDIAVIDRVEFVKGPSAFMNALGDPAGSYNIVTKSADGKKRTDFTLSQGSFNLLRGEADISGKYKEDNKLYYRLNLVGMHKKGFMKYDDNSRIVIAPSIQYNFDENTSISAQYIYQHLSYNMLSEAQISPYGFGTLPYDFTITDPSSRPYRADANDIFVNFDKTFNKNWSLHTQVSNVNSKSVGAMYWVNGINKVDPDILDRVYVYDAMKYNTFSAQAYAKGHFVTGIFTHNLLTGVDYNYKTNKTQDTWNTATTIYPLSISNPIYSNVINNNSMGGSYNSENDINGVDNLSTGRLSYISPYLMEEISILDGKLKMNVGLRYTYAQGFFNQYGARNKNSDNNLSPRVGINYKINETFSAYGLFDNTFTPLVGKSFEDKPLDPVKGQSFEIGLKKEWMNAFTTTVSIYQIERSHTVTKDPITNNIYQNGQNKAKGIEVDVRGELFPGMYATINYAYTDSKITKDDLNPSLVGKATPDRIRHIQNTWLTYKLPGNFLKGFSISTGYQWLVGRAPRFTTIDPVEMKNIFRMDAGISYEAKRYTFSVMVNNVLDSKQYSTAWKKNDMYYWVQLAPINYRCSLTVKL